MLAVGYDRQDRERALDSLLKWRGSMLPVFYDAGTSDPRYIENHGNLVAREAVAKAMTIATSEEEILKAMEKCIGLGFDHIALAPSGDFEGFLELAQHRILPTFASGIEKGDSTRATRGATPRPTWRISLPSEDSRLASSLNELTSMAF